MVALISIVRGEGELLDVNDAPCPILLSCVIRKITVLFFEIPIPSNYCIQPEHSNAKRYSPAGRGAKLPAGHFGQPPVHRHQILRYMVRNGWPSQPPRKFGWIRSSSTSLWVTMVFHWIKRTALRRIFYKKNGKREKIRSIVYIPNNHDFLISSLIYFPFMVFFMRAHM